MLKKLGIMPVPFRNQAFLGTNLQSILMADFADDLELFNRNKHDDFCFSPKDNAYIFAE